MAKKCNFSTQRRDEKPRASIHQKTCYQLPAPQKMKKDGFFSKNGTHFQE